MHNWINVIPSHPTNTITQDPLQQYHTVNSRERKLVALFKNQLLSTVKHFYTSSYIFFYPAISTWQLYSKTRQFFFSTRRNATKINRMNHPRIKGTILSRTRSVKTALISGGPTSRFERSLRDASREYQRDSRRSKHYYFLWTQFSDLSQDKIKKAKYLNKFDSYQRIVINIEQTFCHLYMCISVFIDDNRNNDWREYIEI